MKYGKERFYCSKGKKNFLNTTNGKKKSTVNLQSGRKLGKVTFCQCSESFEKWGKLRCEVLM